MQCLAFLPIEQLDISSVRHVQFENGLGKTTKGKELLSSNGYLWRKKTVLADGVTQSWRCPRKTCPAGARSKAGDPETLQVIRAHTCKSSDAAVEARRVVNAVVEDALLHRHASIPELIAKHRMGITDDVKKLLKDANIIRKVNRARARKNPDQDNKLEYVEVAGRFTVRMDADQFELFNRRITEQNGNGCHFFLSGEADEDSEEVDQKPFAHCLSLIT